MAAAIIDLSDMDTFQERQLTKPIYLPSKYETSLKGRMISGFSERVWYVGKKLGNLK